jgi:hypothetical protein
LEDCVTEEPKLSIMSEVRFVNKKF